MAYEVKPLKNVDWDRCISVNVQIAWSMSTRSAEARKGVRASRERWCCVDLGALLGNVCMFVLVDIA